MDNDLITEKLINSLQPSKKNPICSKTLNSTATHELFYYRREHNYNTRTMRQGPRARFGWQKAREDEEASRGHRDVPSSGGLPRLKKGQPITVRRVDEMEVRLPLAWKSHPVLIDPHPTPSLILRLLYRRLRARFSPLSTQCPFMLFLNLPFSPLFANHPLILAPCHSLLIAPSLFASVFAL